MKNIQKKSAFTLIELIIVIAVLAILYTVAIKGFSTEGAKDPVRMSAMGEVSEKLQIFLQEYGGVYPNNASKGKNYPSGCSVSGYESLIACFVSLGYIKQDSETYKKLKNDPNQGESNGTNDYAYYYGTANKGTIYKICALAGKQSTANLVGLDGNSASEGGRYICIVSPDTKMTDVTSMAK